MDTDGKFALGVVNARNGDGEGLDVGCALPSSFSSTSISDVELLNMGISDCEIFMDSNAQQRMTHVVLHWRTITAEGFLSWTNHDVDEAEVAKFDQRCELQVRAANLMESRGSYRCYMGRAFQCKSSSL